MAISKFTTTSVPQDTSPNLRAWLDDQMRRLQVLVNNSAQLEDEKLPDELLSDNVPLLDAASNTFTGTMVVPAGASGTPSLSFAGNLDTGISGPSADRIDIITGGVSRHLFRTTDFLCATPIYITERAAAGADLAGRGQLWVKNTTPCELWFTDDAGTDTKIV